MAARHPQPQSIDDAFAWHVALVESVRLHRIAALAAVRSGAAVEPRLIGLTADEINDLFDQQRHEIDGMCIVNIVAAAEATIRADYRSRLRTNRANPLAAAYRRFQRVLAGRKAHRPDFDRGGILDALKATAVVPNHLITDFRHALQLRHWFAHGRYWLLQTSLADDPADVYAACSASLAALPPP